MLFSPGTIKTSLVSFYRKQTLPNTDFFFNIQCSVTYIYGKIEISWKTQKQRISFYRRINCCLIDLQINFVPRAVKDNIKTKDNNRIYRKANKLNFNMQVNVHKIQ